MHVLMFQGTTLLTLFRHCLILNCATFNSLLSLDWRMHVQMNLLANFVWLTEEQNMRAGLKSSDLANGEQYVTSIGILMMLG